MISSLTKRLDEKLQKFGSKLQVAELQVSEQYAKLFKIFRCISKIGT